LDFLLLLKAGFLLLPAGAAMVVASTTVRQGGNIKSAAVLRDGLILFAVGAVATIFAAWTRRWPEPPDSGFEFAFGAAGAFIMLGVIELFRFLVFGKPKGARRLAQAGRFVSLLGAVCVVVWIIGSKCFGL